MSIFVTYLLHRLFEKISLSQSVLSSEMHSKIYKVPREVKEIYLYYICVYACVCISVVCLHAGTCMALCASNWVIMKKVPPKSVMLGIKEFVYQELPY